jgi:hypothetical protein
MTTCAAGTKLSCAFLPLWGYEQVSMAMFSLSHGEEKESMTKTQVVTHCALLCLSDMSFSVILDICAVRHASDRQAEIYHDTNLTPSNAVSDTSS